MVSMSSLRTLQELRRQGSVHAAAQSMHLAPSSVSHRIKGLAEACGMALYERDGRGGRLTDQGEMVAELAEEVTRLWDRGLTGVRNGGGPLPRRTIRIGAFPSALGECVLPAVERLRDTRNFRIEVLEVDPREAASLVEHAQLDMVVTLREILDTDLAGDPRLTSYGLWREPFALVMPKGFIATGKEYDSARNYADLPWVLPRRGSACDQMVGRYLARLGIRPRAAARSDDWSIVQRMVRAVQAVTLVPVSCLHPADDGVRVVALREGEVLERTAVLLESADTAGSRWLPAVRRELMDSVGRMADRVARSAQPKLGGVVPYSPKGAGAEAPSFG
ncbi:LysR family transcriptional regulator [Streptomyces sp. V3I7]|uniref:LysR family transcriptional regulator n=1 Tax=Streptomyces sp. V3I7 TaxID=3042278 RepID=UPI0027864B21|nr:LysR family transcriptional regulator [Streptomyces sp. V3I7]MDQ0992839.1 DNA-binding transcriptional LysR family regulator [Streptomyces sp. V3I7]